MPEKIMIRLSSIHFRDMEIPLKIPLAVTVSKRGHRTFVENEEVSCFGVGRDFQEALYDFSSQFVLTINVANAYGRYGNDYCRIAMHHVDGL